MANTKFILSKIKIEGTLRDIIAKTTGDYTTVTYKGEETTLSNALAGILADISNLPTDTGIDGKITAAVNAVKTDIMGGAVPETLDTLKEIADYIEQHKETAEALNAAIGNKVDKVEGKGLSTEDFTAEFKAILESLPTITAVDVTAWNNKVDKEEGMGLSANNFTNALKEKLESTESVSAEEKVSWNNKVDKVEGKGLSTNDFTNEMKTKVENMSTVRYGTAIPEDIKDGELFIQIVN